MKVKIHGGTAKAEENLCPTCKYVKVVRGAALGEEIVHCGMIERDIRFRVTECSDYLHKNQPYLGEMREIAWVLVTKRAGREIGFVRARDLSRAEREKLRVDDE